MAAVSPMATDIYLASIPAAAEYFRTPITAVQLSLSTYMIGMALGQLVLGPVSDRLGRYGLIVAGTSVFTLSSAGIALSTSIEMMLVLRAVQGIAGAAGVVVGRAMVSDTVSGITRAGTGRAHGVDCVSVRSLAASTGRITALHHALADLLRARWRDQSPLALRKY